MQISFDIKDLYGRVRWNLPFPALLFPQASKDIKSLQEINTSNPQNLLGDAIFGEVELGGIKFAIPPTISLSSQLSVTETPVAGMDGTVKEVISVQDYNVNLKCFLTNNEIEEVSGGRFTLKIHKDEVPEDRLREIRDLFESKKSQRVISPVLNLFNIQYLLIKSISMPELDEYSSIIPVELNCVSDKPLNIRLNQNL